MFNVNDMAMFTRSDYNAKIFIKIILNGNNEVAL